MIQYLFFHLVKGEFVGRKNRSEGLLGCDASHAADVIDTSGKRGRGEMLTRTRGWKGREIAEGAIGREQGGPFHNQLGGE